MRIDVLKGYDKGGRKKEDATHSVMIISEERQQEWGNLKEKTR